MTTLNPKFFSTRVVIDSPKPSKCLNVKMTRSIFWLHALFVRVPASVGPLWRAEDALSLQQGIELEYQRLEVYDPKP